MIARTRPTLLFGLALAADSVGPGANDIPSVDDPLRLDLPALHTGPSDFPSASTVRVFGALYLGAELEQAGVVPVAELLADERYSLNLASYEAAAKLDDFATRRHQWYDRAGRVQIYARLFGIGPAATNEAGALVNREFVSLLAGLCRSLTRYADAGFGGAGYGGLEAGVQIAAEALLANIAPRALGNTVVAARRLNDQVRHAVDLLRDPPIGALVGAHTLQQTLVNILGQEAPDVQRLIDAGLSGQKVLEWLANVLPRIADTTTHVPLVTIGDPIAVTAALWLHAAGLDSPVQQVAA
jgi:hypothetical protein